MILIPGELLAASARRFLSVRALEGITPALKSSHALAYVGQLAGKRI